MMIAKQLNAIELPLKGRRVIEASAGTGKTWTLAALYVRLVLGHQRDEPLLPPQILVMTFTEAATAELRERIRNRLRDAAIWFDSHASHRPLPEGFDADSFLQQLLDSHDKDIWPQCSLRLNQAADWMDEAAIYTIHGWSRRMLSQYALKSQILFEQTHLEDANDLILELVQDYWRTWLYPLDANALPEMLRWSGASPQETRKLIEQHWQQIDKSPNHDIAQAENLLTPHQILEQRQQDLSELTELAQKVRQHWSNELTQTLHKEKISGVQERYKDNWLSQLHGFLNNTPDSPTDKLDNLGWANLTKKKWPHADLWQTPLQALDEYLAACKQPSEGKDQLLQHMSLTVRQAYIKAKLERAAFDFSDLLQQLYTALHKDNGELATSIRQQYPVALVDEFQDTDPWQYGSLDRIYAHESCTSKNALIMIGDPKQAIYSFRGADLNTYIQARQRACELADDAVYTLSDNFRSTPELVQSVNHLFSQIDHPFGAREDQAIEFIEVNAKGKSQSLQLHGQSIPALNFWQLENSDNTISAASHQSKFAEIFSNQIAQLLNDGVATPSQMAVLVRKHDQATAMQNALRQRGVASVYLSDNSSVYESEEALGLWRFLRACLSPNRMQRVRQALASKTWQLSTDELTFIFVDETSWQQMVEQFHQWHSLWQTQGILPLIHHWLHASICGATLAQRLLSQNNERSLSNLLHLGELLEHQARHVEGLHAVLRHLEQSILQPPRSAESQKSRLETDDQCVQIITYHKSKGLQYPLVFIPYAGSFNYKGSEEDESDSNASVLSPLEDMRLLYVALTRAQQAMWVGVAETHLDMTAKPPIKMSALSTLLDRKQRGDLAARISEISQACSSIAVNTFHLDVDLPVVSYQAPAPEVNAQRLRTLTRHQFERWWTSSFSTLTRNLDSHSFADDRHDDALADAQPSVVLDETLETQVAPTATQWQQFPSGARYGTLLHDLLEWQSHNNWCLVNDSNGQKQKEWHELVQRKAQWLSLKDTDIALLNNWLTTILKKPLPLGELGGTLALQHISQDRLWAEMSFHFETHHVDVTHLDQLIQQHIFPEVKRPALQRNELNGMITGFMDLIFEHEGRYWILDYKSNWLHNYSTSELTQAVASKRYEVQYVLYTLAMHRLLKVRLPNYDYDTHMGASVYLFLRGIDTDHAGVHLMRIPRQLIEALDDCFAGAAA